MNSNVLINIFRKLIKYQIQIRDAINKSVGNALVITEGPTDWKHMKAAKNALSQKEENKTLFSGMDLQSKCNSSSTTKLK